MQSDDPNIYYSITQQYAEYQNKFEYHICFTLLKIYAHRSSEPIIQSKVIS